MNSENENETEIAVTTKNFQNIIGELNKAKNSVFFHKDRNDEIPFNIVPK
jgi:hypothetical protein